MKLQVVLEPSEEGGFTASVPSLPGCISEGDTREDALRSIRKRSSFTLNPSRTIFRERTELSSRSSLSEGPLARPEVVSTFSSVIPRSAATRNLS